MAHSRSGFPRARSQRRSTGWDLGPGGSVLTAFSATESKILGSGLTPTTEGLTVVRLRGHFTFGAITIAAAAGGMHGAIGVGLCTSEAFAIGITAVPTPIADAGRDIWLYHNYFDIHRTIDTDPRPVSFDVDSKAMRKLAVGMVVFAVVEVVEVGDVSAEAYFDSRLLFKLP